MIVAAMLGLVVGAGGTAYFGVDRGTAARIEPIAPQTTSQSIAGTDRFDVRAIAAEELDAGARAQIARAIGHATVAELQTLLAEFALQPPSAQRSFVLTAVVSRIAAEDVNLALQRLGEQFLDPRTARQLGLTVLEHSEPEAASIEAVLAALPQMDADRFWQETIAAFAVASPAAALSIALELEERDRRTRDVHEVAAIWLEHDPGTALGYADSIADPDQRRTFESALLTELAKHDVAATLAYVEEAYGEASSEGERLLTAVVRGLSREAPAAGLELTEHLGERTRMGWGRSAAGWLARTDPEAAMRYAEVPSKGRFDRTRTTIATVLGEQDADTALEWVRSLDPMPEDLASAVLGGVARVDPLRAIAVGEELGIVGNLRDIDTMRRSASLVAERVLAIQDAGQREEWLRSLMGGWARVDETAALDWAIVNAANVSPRIIADLAQQRGGRDPAAALLEASRLPNDVQDEWVQAVVRGTMMQDPLAALSWVDQFRGLPVYDAAAAAVVGTAVWADPEPAAAVFQTLSPQRQAAVAQGLAQSWARTDMAQARTWVVGLPAGPVRDAGLSGIVALGRGSPEPALLAQFSSDAARQDAVVVVVQRVGRSDPVEARRLIDEYLSDAAKREQAENLLAGLQR